MSDPAQPPAATDGATQTAAPTQGPRPSTPPLLSILAASFAGLGLILAFVLAGFAWLPCLAAIVLAIIALVRRSRLRGLAIAGIVVAPIAWLIAIIVAVASIASGIGTAIDQVDDAPSSASQPDDSGDGGAGVHEAAVGDTVTNDDGVSFTVTKITCGLAKAGDNEFLEEKANGQFCEVKFTVDNGSSDSITVTASDVTGSIGDAKYESNTTASKFGDDYFSTDINPGLSSNCVVYIDIPKDKQLDFITYSPLFSFGGDIVVKAS